MTSRQSQNGRVCKWLAETGRLIHKHPDVSIEVEFSNRLVDIIGEKFDLAVRLGVLTDSRFVARSICPRRRLVCASPGYLERAGIPKHPGDLNEHACLRFTGKSNPRAWEFLDQAGKLVSVPVSGPFDSDDAEVVINAAVADLGLAYAAYWVVARQLADGSLVQVLSK